MTRTLAIALVLSVATAIPVWAEEWSFTGGDGQTVTLDEMPVRIITNQDAAAGLIPLGVRPVGIYASGAVSESKPLQGLDLTGIEIIGEVWNEVDIEKAAALEPDLIISEYWPLEKAWGGGDQVVPFLSQLAPITGPGQGSSVLALIEDYEKLAESLGADLSRPEVMADKAAFNTALDDFKTAVAAKPGLTVLAGLAGAEGLRVAAVAGAAELQDFRNWGLDIIDPETADDRGYWEVLSWELADKYQPDLFLIDNRRDSNVAAAMAEPKLTPMKAAEAGQFAEWPAFWLRNYGAYARELTKLTAAINAADENLTE